MLRHVAGLTPGFFSNPSEDGRRGGDGGGETGRIGLASALSPSGGQLARIFEGRSYTVGISHGHCDSMKPLRYEQERLASADRSDSSTMAIASSPAEVIATALCWACALVGLSSEILCVGYSDGSVRAYAPGDGGQILFSQRYHDKSPVIRIKLQATSVFHHAATSSSTPRNLYSELWILHEDGTLVALHLSQLRRAMQSTFNGSKPDEGCEHLKWQLQRQFEFVDFAAASPARPNLFQSRTMSSTANVLVWEMQPFCCVFRADGEKPGAPVTLQDAVSELVGWAGGAVLSSAAAFAPSWLSGITGSSRGGPASSPDEAKHTQTENSGLPWNDVAFKRFPSSQTT